MLIKAELEFELGRSEDACHHARDGLTELKLVVADKTWQGRRDLARAQVVLAHCLAGCGDTEASTQEYQRAYTMFEDLDAEEPGRIRKEQDIVKRKLGDKLSAPGGISTDNGMQ